jgi:hypothetical protein
MSDRSQWPAFIRASLWGIKHCWLAWLFVWLSVAIAIGLLAYGFTDRRGFIGAIAFVGVALLYYFPLRWVDQNSTWSQEK